MKASYTSTHDAPTAASVVVLEGDMPLRSDNGDIVLLWETPSPVQARGIITSYQINFEEDLTNNLDGARQRRQDDCTRNVCMLRIGQIQGCCLVGAGQTSATISGLDSSVTYRVSVTAVNGAGLGEAQIFTVEAEGEDESCE